MTTTISADQRYIELQRALQHTSAPGARAYQSAYTTLNRLSEQWESAAAAHETATPSVVNRAYGLFILQEFTQRFYDEFAGFIGTEEFLAEQQRGRKRSKADADADVQADADEE